MASPIRILIAVALASVLATTVAAAASTPSVRLVRIAPLEISGAGFGSRAPVRVTVNWNTGRLQKSVRATRSGAITIAFAQSLSTFGCRSVLIEAVAGNGRRADWRPSSKICFALAVPVTP